MILGDQLFKGSPGMPPDCPIFMREDLGLATRYRHHQQKLVLFFSAMRHFAASCGRQVIYQTLGSDSLTFTEALVKTCQEQSITKVWLYPSSDPFELDLGSFGIETTVVSHNPMFVTPKLEWQSYTGTTKRRQMADFYIWQRKRMNILLTLDCGPVGGKWSFDAENQKRLPVTVIPAAVQMVEPDLVTTEVISLISKWFPEHPGDARDFCYAVTHEGAEAWLDQFLVERLGLFGDFEDAMPQRERTIFHSILTPYLNCGLLTPDQVIEATVDLDVPLNSKEGFLRQIIGWREFVFGMSGEYETVPNYFGHERRLGRAWYEGTTGLPPVDLAIRRAKRYGYCHHIERLMVLGAVMLMSEIHPEDIYTWFMEMFIDSAEWVMKPNVFGMSQYADGGLFATKPYICGSAYILKMSDWVKGPWCDVWDGLYWRFIQRNMQTFARNPRMAVMVQMAEKLDPSRKKRIFAAAEAFIERTSTRT